MTTAPAAVAIPLSDLELRRALDRGDKTAVAALYAGEGRRRLAVGDTDDAMFLLTNAYVFALDAGDVGHAEELRWTLRQHGRED